MTMMAGAVVAPSLPQINKVFDDVEYAGILTRLILTLPALFIAIFSPLYGYLVDKYGRKKFLVFALVLYGISGTSGFYLHDLYLILTGRVFLGISVAGIMTIIITLVGDYYKGDERNNFVGLQGAFMGLGGVFFITVAGWLADIHWQMPFLIYAFAFPTLALVVIFIYEPRINEQEQISFHSVKNKVTYPKYLLNFVLVTIFFGVVIFYMLPVQIPFILKKLPGISNSMVGYAIAISTLFSAAVSMNYKRIKKRFSFPVIYAIAFAFIGIGYLAISLASEYYQYIAGLIISGLGTGLLMPTGNLWIMKLAQPMVRGKLMGRASTAAFLGMFCSPILIQPLINLGNVSFAFKSAGIITLIVGVIFFSIRNKVFFKY